MASDKTLPLSVRIGIRDLFDAENSIPKASLAKVNELTGIQYQIVVQWPLLRDGIPSTTLDNDSFVRKICEIISAFLETLLKKLNQDHDNFADNFLDRTQKGKRIEFGVHPSESAFTPFTRYEESGILRLFFPKVKAAYVYTSIGAFGADLEAALGGPQANPADAMRTKGSSMAFPAGAGSFGGSGQASRFPNLQELPRPDTLLLEAPLYLMLKATADAMYVDGHQPSVALINDYLEHHSDGSKYRQWGLDLWLRPSLFGVAVKQLIVSYQRPSVQYPSLNPLLLVALIEGPLGFEPVEGSRGQDGTWIWRRENGFS